MTASCTKSSIKQIARSQLKRVTRRRSSQNLSIGLELEYPLISENGNMGYCQSVIADLAKRQGWKLKTSYDIHQAPLAAALHLDSGTLVTTDAGIGTMEIIMAPYSKLADIQETLTSLMSVITSIALKHKQVVLGYGNQPQSPININNLVQKPRYFALMEAVGENLLSLMTTVTVLQAHVDVSGPEQMVLFTSFFNAISPVLVAQHGNSWMSEGKDTGMCAWRETAWDGFGKRAGILTDGDKWFEDYDRLVSHQANMQYIFHETAPNKFEPSQKNFSEWLETKNPTDEEATEAWLSHEACLWWTARPRVAYATVEIRTPDQQLPGGQMLFPALVKGCALKPELMEDFLAEYNPNQIKELYRAAIRDGMGAVYISDVVHRVFKIASQGLQELPEENQHLKFRKACPAQISRQSCKNPHELIASATWQ